MYCMVPPAYRASSDLRFPASGRTVLKIGNLLDRNKGHRIMAFMEFESADSPNYGMLISRFEESRQWDRALETAQEWLSREPRGGRAHLAAGQALLNLGRPAEAEHHLAQALAQNPDSDLALRFMSIAQFRQKRFREADDSINKALSLNPEGAFHWFHLADMFFQQGDLASAKKYAKRARDLAPQNADILGLLARCEPTDDDSRLWKYRQALELDPENAEIHNNIGVYYLNSKADYERAEEYFRRALFFEPTLKVARSNLFITVRHSDAVYRALCGPKDIFLRWLHIGREECQRSIPFYLPPLFIARQLCWMLASQLALAGLILWAMWFWPLVKVYEFIMVGDIRARTGEIGSRRGGFLNYRKWPPRLRLAIFAVVLVSFWGGLAYLCVAFPVADDGVLFGIIGVGLLLGLLGLIGSSIWGHAKKMRNRFHVRRRARRLGGSLLPDSENVEAPWMNEP